MKKMTKHERRVTKEWRTGSWPCELSSFGLRLVSTFVIRISSFI
jgi:hypothetical protein